MERGTLEWLERVLNLHMEKEAQRKKKDEKKDSKGNGGYPPPSPPSSSSSSSSSPSHTTSSSTTTTTDTHSKTPRGKIPLLKLDIKFEIPMYNGEVNAKKLDNWI